MKKLNSDNFLITGGAGFIGSSLVKYLNKKYNIFVIDDLSLGKKSQIKTKNFYKFNLLDKKKLNSFFLKNKIDLVIHVAGHTNLRLSEKHPSKFYKNNFHATQNLVDMIIKHKIRKFIFSSTASVYGKPKKIPIKENHKCKPISVYGKTKLLSEKYIIRKSKKNFKYIIFRYFNVAGAFYKDLLGEIKNPPEHLIPIIIRQVFKKKKINIYNNFNTKDGTGIRDYIHINDICSAHYKAIKYLNLKKNNKSNILNLGTKKGISTLEVVKALSKIMKKKIPKNFINKKKGEPDILISDTTKSEKILKWKVNKKITSILYDSIKWEKLVKKFNF